MMRRTVIFALLFVSIVLSAQDKFVERRLDNVLMDAVTLLDNSEYDKSLRLLKQLEKIDSTSDAVQYYIGYCNYLKGDNEAALEYLRKASSLDPGNPWYREVLATACQAAGKYAECRDILIGLYKEYPSRYASPYIYSLLGEKAFLEGDLQTALKRYNEALEMDENYSPAILGLAEVYGRSSNIPAFLTNLKRFLSSGDVGSADKVEYLSNMISQIDGSFFFSWSAQLDDLVQTVADAPDAGPEALKYAGQWFYGTERKEKGYEYFNRWLEKFPDDYEANATVMQIALVDKRYRDAAASFDRLFELAGDDKEKLLELYSLAGDTYHELGDEALAFSSYKKALKIDPEYAPVLNNYAYYLCQKGKSMRKALKMSAISVKVDSENSSYLDTYGWILYLLKRPEEAKVQFKRAMVFGGHDSDVVMDHYAVVLEALGERETAEYYRSLAEKKRNGK